VKTRRIACASLGKAPDGLPWRLSIDRGPSAADLLLPIAARLGYGAGGDFQEMALGDLAARLGELLDLRDIRRVEMADGPRECYITSRPVASIVGPTLLATLTPAGVHVWPWRSSTVREETRNATVIPANSPGERPPVQVDIASGHLALPLDGSAPLLVKRIDDPDGHPSFRYARPFAPESLALFRTGRFRFCAQDRFEREGEIADTAAYQDALRRSLRYDSFGAMTCTVARAEVVALLADVADRLEGLHAAGKIHGDVKPANILMTAESAEIIDSLELAPGIKSPAMTPEWAAPEQVVGETVEAATDQYPLGLILCEMLSGVMYGEEVNFVVPVGGAKVERVRLLRNAGVYLPPESAPVAAAGLAPWQRFLDRCLRFAPGARFGSMKELAEELRGLLSAHSLTGELSMTPRFGRLAAEQDGPLSWELDDIRS
jgi:hypothetical protein